VVSSICGCYESYCARYQDQPLNAGSKFITLPSNCENKARIKHILRDCETYLGLRERLAANEGARSFIHESPRNRTPLGHAHRDHIRDLSIEQIREMYRQAVRQLLDEAAETEEFFRAGIVAIDITEATRLLEIELVTKTKSSGRKRTPTTMHTSGATV